jgi:hypothetical protein
LRASKDGPRAPSPRPSFEARRRGEHLRMTSEVVRLRKFHLSPITSHTSALSRREAPEVCVSLSPRQEGAGNAGCALHPRSRVQKVERKVHTSIQGSGGNPTSPAQWLYGLYRAHPGVSGLPAPVASRKPALRPGRAFAPPKDLTPTIEASGPHDFAVRFGTARPARPATAHGVYPALPSHRAHDAFASTASHPNVR